MYLKHSRHILVAGNLKQTVFVQIIQFKRHQNGAKNSPMLVNERSISKRLKGLLCFDYITDI